MSCLTRLQARIGHNRNIHEIREACLVIGTAAASASWPAHLAEAATPPAHTGSISGLEFWVRKCAALWLGGPDRQTWAPFVLNSSISFLCVLICSFIWTEHWYEPLPSGSICLHSPLLHVHSSFSPAPTCSNVRRATRWRGNSLF